MQKQKKYVLIDDDPTYLSVMAAQAKAFGIDLETFPSLMDLGTVGLLGKYDVAIVDYDLGQMNGVEIAEYLSALFGDIPMVLVSSTNREPDTVPWPDSIKSFVNKDQGHEHILIQAQISAGNYFEHSI